MSADAPRRDGLRPAGARSLPGTSVPGYSQLIFSLRPEGGRTREHACALRAGQIEGGVAPQGLKALATNARPPGEASSANLNRVAESSLRRLGRCTQHQWFAVVSSRVVAIVVLFTQAALADDQATIRRANDRELTTQPRPARTGSSSTQPTTASTTTQRFEGSPASQPDALYEPAGEDARAPADVDARPLALRFFNLRYDEDFRYLDEYPELREAEPRRWLKNLPVGDDWRVDVGGEFRLRMEARTNAVFSSVPQTQNTQQNYRWLLHANVRYRNLFRLFAQGIVAHVEDQDGPFQPAQENHGDVQQLFGDLRILGEDVPLTLRVGRQELAYGIYRLVGPLDWVSNRRRFDAVKLFYTSDTWDIDAFYAKPVVVELHSADRWNEDHDFYGLYATYKGIPGHVVDGYFFAIDRTEDTLNPNGHSGDQSIYTFGTRFAGKAGGWDYDTELSGQWGQWAGDTVQAWSWAIDGGYTFANVPLSPRLSSGFDVTTGDRNPEDDEVGTFNQLFPFDHVCNGMLDLIGRQNITRTYVGLDLWPIPDKLKVSTVAHFYWLTAREDSIYEAGGTPYLRDETGNSGGELGQELDLWIEWTITPYSSLMFGYAHFFDDNFVHTRVGGDDDPDLFIVQYRYRF